MTQDLSPGYNFAFNIKVMTDIHVSLHFSKNTSSTNILFSYPEGTCIFHSLNNGTVIQVRKQ